MLYDDSEILLKLPLLESLLDISLNYCHIKLLSSFYQVKLVVNQFNRSQKMIRCQKNKQKKSERRLTGM